MLWRGIAGGAPLVLRKTRGVELSSISISAHCYKGAVNDGHMCCVPQPHAKAAKAAKAQRHPSSTKTPGSSFAKAPPCPCLSASTWPLLRQRGTARVVPKRPIWALPNAQHIGANTMQTTQFSTRTNFLRWHSGQAVLFKWLGDKVSAAMFTAPQNCQIINLLS